VNFEIYQRGVFSIPNDHFYEILLILYFEAGEMMNARKDASTSE
tara:strand:- start:47 stop:178 length:132 start_codon:yes stop_codon:yes gene_type:complete